MTPSAAGGLGLAKGLMPFVAPAGPGIRPAPREINASLGRLWCSDEPFGAQVPRLAAYRGVTRIGGLCLAAEVFDWRRFPRARPFMSFTGLVPSEHSTGKSQRRGSITRAGNAH
ncbi:MAG: transposase, partial [Acidimicrobiales bacterium]